MMLGTKGVSTPDPKYPRNMDPGVYEVEITGFTYEKGTAADSEWFDVFFQNSSKEVHRERLFCNDVGKNNTSPFHYALGQIKHLAVNTLQNGSLITEEQIDSIAAATKKDLAEAYNAVFTGGKLRISLSKFTKTTGKSYVQFSYVPFAQSILEENKLRFMDKENVKISTPASTQKIENLI